MPKWFKTTSVSFNGNFDGAGKQIPVYTDAYVDIEDISHVCACKCKDSAYVVIIFKSGRQRAGNMMIPVSDFERLLKSKEITII